MALGDLFKKKQAAPQPALDTPPLSGPVDIPLTQVISMQGQGLTNNQIIQTLQRQGYPPQSIYDALAQAEAKKSIEPLHVPGETPPPMDQQSGSAPQGAHPESEAMVEQIIEEKWHELQKELGKMNEWKELLTSRIDKMEQSLTDVKGDLDGLHKAIVSRIGEYDKTLLDVGTEIKAMEKVFTKVLPDLTSSVQELSRITGNVKKITK